MISVVIPVYKEGFNPIFKESLMLLSLFKNVEVLCIGKGLDLSTKKVIDQFPNANYFPSNLNSRAERLNDGLKLANSDIVVFHHPRSRLTRKGLNYLIAHKDEISWGAFTHQFNKKSLFYSFTSWYSNQVRGKLKSIFYLDHCLVVNLKKISKKECQFPNVDIFEDTLLCNKLKKISKPTLIPFPSITSTIRFERKGILRQAVINQLMKLGYFLKLSDKSMNKLYEKELELNSAY